MNNYIAIHCLGDISYVSTITMVTIIPLALTYIFTPILLKKFDKIQIYRIATAASGLLGIAMFFAGYQTLWVFLAFTALRSLCTGMMRIIFPQGKYIPAPFDVRHIHAIPLFL